MVLIFLLFTLVDVDRKLFVKEEVEACIILNYLLPEKLTGTCTYLFFCGLHHI